MGNWLTTKQLAERLQLAEITLRLWRATGKGPVVHRFGSRCMYSENDVEAWIRSCRQLPDAPAAPSAQVTTL